MAVIHVLDKHTAELIAAGDVERHHADRRDGHRKREYRRRLGNRLSAYAAHIDDDLALVAERRIDRDQQHEHRRRLDTAAGTAGADADEHQHYGQRLRESRHARLAERRKARGTRGDRLEERVDDLVADAHIADGLGVVEFRRENADRSDEYQRRSQGDDDLGVQLELAPPTVVRDVGHDHKAYAAQHDQQHRDDQDERVFGEHAVRRPLGRDDVKAGVAERHNAVEQPVPHRKSCGIVARECEREQQRADQFGRDGHFENVEREPFEVVHAVVGQLLGHADALAQRNFVTNEKIDARRDGHKSEPAYLNQKQYHHMSERGEIGGDGVDDKPGDTGRARRGEQSVHKRQRAGSRGRPRQHQQRRADHDDGKKAEHDQPDRGEDALCHMSESKLAFHTTSLRFKSYYTPYPIKRQ